jgi:hypothetical protein
VWTNDDEENETLRRTIWRKLLTKEDMSQILAPLRPGVDIETILDAEEKDGSVWVWREWAYDSVAWLADDIFTYHIGQGNLGRNVPHVVFERYARVGEFVRFPGSLDRKSLPIRAKFKNPLAVSRVRTLSTQDRYE